MPPRIVLQQGGTERAVALVGDAVRVGSGAGCSLVLRDPAVSREHAEFKPAGGVWKVVDLESASGTKVNGRFVNQQSLIHGDIVEIGASRLLYLEAGGAPGDAPVPAPLPSPAAAPVAPAPPASAPPAPSPAAAPVPAPGPIPAPAPAPARVAVRAPAPSLPRPVRRRSGGGFEMAILWGLIGLFGLVLAFVLGGGLGEKAGPNAHLAARMKGLNKEGRFEEVLAMEKQADLSDEPTMRLVQDQLDLARNSLRAKRISVLEKKSEEYLLWQIQKWQQDNRRDAEGLIRRYDEYLERFPGTAHWKSVADRREQLAGAPSPVYLRMVADGTLDRIPPETPAPDPGALTIGQRLRLAAEEADGLVEGRRFSAAMEVYGALLRDHVSGLPEFEQAPYRAEVQKRMDKIEKAAYKAFELLEQEAFTLSETGRLDEAESLYRTALETYGLGPIRDRCRVELERIAGMRGR